MGTDCIALWDKVLYELRSVGAVVAKAVGQEQDGFGIGGR